MQDEGWNTIELKEEERPRVAAEELRLMAEELDPDDYDDAVQFFLQEIEEGTAGQEEVRRTATLLLQDEVDFAPELKDAGVEPDERLIALLLACGADVNVRNPYGELPLHLAARYGYTNIVRMLLAAGARRDARNAAGQLPVQVAANSVPVDLLTPTPTGQDDGARCHCGYGHGSGCCDGQHHSDDTGPAEGHRCCRH